MKNNRESKANDNSQVARPVNLRFDHMSVATVAVAGTLAYWQPDATQKVAVETGRWEKRSLLPLGTDEYLLLVDSQWKADPPGKTGFLYRSSA